jgi:hypothetical protein
METTNSNICQNCQGYKSTPFYWSSTASPKMCNCPVNPRYDLAWECPRCKKINAPWKNSCDCNPPTNNGHTYYPQQHITIKNNYIQ